MLSCGTRAKLIRADIIGSPRKSVVKITDNNTANKLHLNFQFSYLLSDSIKMNIGGHPKVNSDGVFEVQPVTGEEYFYSDPKINNSKYKGDNMFWKVPQGHLLFEVDKTFDSFSIGAGFNLSISNSVKYSSNNFRFGYFKFYDWFGWRADYIIHHNTLSTRVNYTTKIANKDNLERVLFHTVEEEKSEWNHEFAFSINTTKSNWVLNYYLALNFGNQGLYNLIDEEGDGFGVDYQSQFRNISIGAYHQFNNSQRVIFGLKINANREIGNEVVTPGFVLQYDIAY